MQNTDNNKEIIFTLVQYFLNEPPLIIWGSGATISFGVPSMSDLNTKLNQEITGFDSQNNNLENELSKPKYEKEMPQIRQLIWNEVNQADISVLEKIISDNNNEFDGIKLLIKKFIDAHPKLLNIITTNYDRVLEYVMSYNNLLYTDGFNGKVLSSFDENNFKNKDITNLVKVHGSLNWFDVNNETCFIPFSGLSEKPRIIPPSNKKYEESYSSPYRELIKKSDDLIKTASSFLVVGFGFNDEHITPEITKKIKNGTPIVLITKTVSPSSLKELKNAKKYITFEENNGKTKVTYKKNNISQKQEIELEGDLWQLNNFMEIL